MRMGLEDIFKAIVDELGDDSIGSNFKMLFNEKKDEFPIPIKKPFWEDNKQQPEVKSKEQAQKDKKKTKNTPNEFDKDEMVSNEKSLEAQLARLNQKESSYEYITSLEKEELRRGIIMSEILGKPRCKQRMRRRV